MTAEEKEKIGAVLKLARLDKGYSVYEVAIQMGKKESAVELIEDGFFNNLEEIEEYMHFLRLGSNAISPGKIEKISSVDEMYDMYMCNIFNINDNLDQFEEKGTLVEQARKFCAIIKDLKGETVPTDIDNAIVVLFVIIGKSKLISKGDFDISDVIACMNNPGLLEEHLMTISKWDLKTNDIHHKAHIDLYGWEKGYIRANILNNSNVITEEFKEIACDINQLFGKQ